MLGRTLPWVTRLGGTAIVGGGLAGYLLRREADNPDGTTVHDVVVVGGGVVGTSIALGLVRASPVASSITLPCREPSDILIRYYARVRRSQPSDTGLSPILACAECFADPDTQWPQAAHSVSRSHERPCCLQAKANKSVVLLERHDIGSGATGLSADTPDRSTRSRLTMTRSAGTLYSLGPVPDPVPADLSVEHLEPFLLHRSTEIIRQFANECSYVQSGCLTLACTPEELASLQQEHSHLVALGYTGVNLLDRRSVELVEPGIQPGSVLGALHTRHSGHCEPAELVQAIASRATAHGADIHINVEVVEILPVQQRRNGKNGSDAQARYILRTDAGVEYHARQVAVASGTWPEFLKTGLGLEVPVVPVKGTMWLTAKLPRGMLRHVIYTEESHMGFAAREHASLDLDAELPVPPRCTHDAKGNQLVRHAYGRQRVDGSIVFGGDRVRATADDFDVDFSGINRHRHDVAAFLAPSIMATAVEGTWAGLMPFALDGKLLVGELVGCELPGLWLATGFGPNGIMLGPSVGEMVAEAMTGFAPLPLAFEEEYNPCRASGGVTVSTPSEEVE